MNPIAEKAFSFGILNKSASDDTALVIRAIVSPNLYVESDLTYDQERNARLFDDLLRVRGVAFRLAKQHLQLGVPRVAPTVFLGPTVPVQLDASPCENPQADALLKRMGTLRAQEFKRMRDLREVPLKKGALGLRLAASALQECVLHVRLQDAKLGFAFRVEHITTNEEHIGDITLVFLPDELVVHQRPQATR